MEDERVERRLAAILEGIARCGRHIGADEGDEIKFLTRADEVIE